MESAGDTIGRYRLIRQLGAGGMGTVWLAERSDGAFERQVALKLLHQDLDGGEPMARFLREREILGGLDAPGIARILDAGVTVDQRPYLVMEAIDGQSIDRFVETSGADERGKLRLLAEAAAAAGHAHSRHVIHRDIKPANVLISADGGVKLIDFGIAAWADRPLGRDAFVTQGPLRFLTEDYASPEQLAGAKISAPADVFALGMIGHELLYGERPKDGQVDRRCTGDLRLVLEGALQRIPEERYANAALFAEDVENVLRGSPVRIKALSRFGRAKRLFRRHRGIFAALGAAGLILAVSLTAASSEFRAARASLTAVRASRATTLSLATSLRRLATEHLTTMAKEAPPGHARERMIMNMSALAKQQGDEELYLACATASLDLAQHWDDLWRAPRTEGADESKDPSQYRQRRDGMVRRAAELLKLSDSKNAAHPDEHRALAARLESLRGSDDGSRLDRRSDI